MKKALAAAIALLSLGIVAQADVFNMGPGLTSLETLTLGGNQISDISALAAVTGLTELYLNENQISDIGALVINIGLGEGDEVYLDNNWLDLSPGSRASQDIETLRDRGVTVHCDNQNPPAHNCSISGTITDSSGQPLVGVEVSADGHATTTAADGTYTIDGLAAGTYTVTPTLAGYEFVESSQQVTVNQAAGSATEVDFIGNRAALLGDLDGDGNPTVGDAIKILRIVVGLDPDDPCADANQNGGTDVGDAIKVLRCVVGLDAWPIG